VKRKLLIVLMAAAVSATSLAGTAFAGPGPEFRLGFRLLADQIPDMVGEAVENEWHNPDNGDGMQRTTRGMMVWRKADNWTAFTDGYRSWVSGPFGVQSRLNTERFGWEIDAPGDTSRLQDRVRLQEQDRDCAQDGSGEQVRERQETRAQRGQP
jgi:hypothetical protein